jgi:flagellar secretion chaperone FliS
MFTPVSARANAAYRTAGAEARVQGASPHQLIGLIYDALLQALRQARSAMERGDVVAKADRLSHAVRLIDEGLLGALNVEEGGDVAANLRGVYDYSLLRLTQANLRNDMAIVDEIIDLFVPVAAAWNQIAPEVTPGR